MIGKRSDPAGDGRRNLHARLDRDVWDLLDNHYLLRRLAGESVTKTEIIEAALREYVAGRGKNSTADAVE